MNFISNANGHYFNLDVKTKSFDLISKDLEHCKVHDSYDEMLKVVSEDENINLVDLKGREFTISENSEFYMITMFGKTKKIDIFNETFYKGRSEEVCFSIGDYISKFSL